MGCCLNIDNLGLEIFNISVILYWVNLTIFYSFKIQTLSLENFKLKERRFQLNQNNITYNNLFIFVLMPILSHINNIVRQRTCLPYLIFRLFESLSCLRVNAHLVKSTLGKHSTRIRTCNPNRYSQDRTYEKHSSRTRAFRSRLAVAFLRHIWRRTTWLGTFPVCRPLLYQNLKIDTVIKKSSI